MEKRNETVVGNPSIEWGLFFNSEGHLLCQSKENNNGECRERETGQAKKKKKNDIENNQFWLISLAKNGSVVPTRHSDSYPGMGVVLTRSETC